MARETLTVEFRPRLWEAFWATLVLLVGLSQLVLGAAFTFTKPTAELTCDRASCHLVAHTLFGGTQDFTLETAALQHSRVNQGAWVVDKQGQRFELGSPTSDAELSRRYVQLAAELQAFLDDPGKPTFTASFPAGTPPMTALFFVIGALAIAWGLKWRRGWKASLVFDRAAGTLVIHQRPWGRTRTIPLSDISRVSASDRVAHTLYGNLRWEDIAVHGAGGRPLWRYRTMFTRKTYRHVQESLASMQSFLSRSG